MIRAGEHDRERIELGAYVLGAVSAADRARLDDHLAGCPECRSELDELAGLPALLSTLSPADAARLAVDETLPPLTLPAAPAPAARALPAARRRRSLRAGPLAAVAAAIAIAAAVAGVGLAGQAKAPSQASGQTAGQTYGVPEGAWRTAASAGGPPAATVMYRPMGWGTQLQVKVNGIPQGIRCQVAVLTASGSRVTAGGWTTDASAGKVFYPGSAAVPAGDVRAFVITIGSSRQVTVPAVPA